MKKYSLYIVVALLVVLPACKSSYVKQKEEFSNRIIKEEKIHVNSDNLINPYREKLSGEMKRVVAESGGPLTRENSQSTLGNFVCDALRFAGAEVFKDVSPDLVLINRGGLRSNLPSGEIRVENIYEVMPFDNEMVLVKLNGARLKEGMATIVSKRHPFWGLKLRLHNDSVAECLLNMARINPESTYFVITSDYLANGGDGFSFMQNPIDFSSSGVRVRDAILAYCEEITKTKGPIVPYTDERLSETK